MSDDKSTRVEISTETLLKLTEDVSRANEGIDNIKDRVTSIEGQVPHSCMYEELVTSIPAIGEKAKNVSKTLSIIVTIATIISGGAIGYALSAKSKASSNTSNVLNLEKTMIRHEKEIGDIEKSMHKTREDLISKINNIPGNVRRAVSEEMENNEEVVILPIDRLRKLSPRERRRRIERLILKIE